VASKLRQFVVYSKLTILTVIAMAVVIVVFKNRGYKTNFWPGADGDPVSTLWLMLATAVSSIVVFWVLSKTRRVLKELAQVRAEQLFAEHAAEQDRLKKNLDEQERRIDEKLRRAVAGDNPRP